MAKNCRKSYKSSNELNKHVKKNSGVTWDCNLCEYSTDDRHNLRAHRKKHMKVGLHKCIPCNKSFHYYMQLKWHRAKPECLKKDSVTGIKWDNMMYDMFPICYSNFIR